MSNDWLAREATSGNWIVSNNATGETICHVRDGGHAVLIEAAPDLLAACQALLEQFEKFAPWENQVQRIVAENAAQVISKARGQK